jgi:hypothetical protein
MRMAARKDQAGGEGGDIEGLPEGLDGANKLEGTDPLQSKSPLLSGYSSHVTSSGAEFVPIISENVFGFGRDINRHMIVSRRMLAQSTLATRKEAAPASGLGKAAEPNATENNKKVKLQRLGVFLASSRPVDVAGAEELGEYGELLSELGFSHLAPSAWEIHARHALLSRAASTASSKGHARISDASVYINRNHQDFLYSR